MYNSVTLESSYIQQERILPGLAYPPERTQCNRQCVHDLGYTAKRQSRLTEFGRLELPIHAKNWMFLRVLRGASSNTFPWICKKICASTEILGGAIQNLKGDAYLY